MVHRSMKNGSRVADKVYLKRVLLTLKDSFTYSDMPDDLPAFVTVCQKQDN